MPSKNRHNISVTPDQWDRITAAAAEAGAKRGMTMSVSEWRRVAAREAVPAAGGVKFGRHRS